MSNVQYLGTNAGFYYTLNSESTWRTFPLAVPLREPRPASVLRSYACDSLDLLQRQTFNINSSQSMGVQELICTLRYNSDQVDLATYFLHHAILRSGSTTYPLRYTTALTTGTSSGGMGSGADVWLVSHAEGVLTQMDRQRISFGDLEVEIRLRALPGNDFSTGSGARWF